MITKLNEKDLLVSICIYVCVLSAFAWLLDDWDLHVIAAGALMGWVYHLGYNNAVSDAQTNS